MLTHNSYPRVLVKHHESEAIAQAFLVSKTPDVLKVNLKGVPLTFERREGNRYIASYSSLALELVSG